MKRLTKRKFDGTGVSIEGATWEAFEKLAQYEDAEESGLLARLPCKAGDTVWFSLREKRLDVSPGIYNGIITRIKAIQRLDQKNLFLADIQFSYIDPWFNDGRTRETEIQASFTDYGSWVRFYLTHKEAEAALKGEKTDG